MRKYTNIDESNIRTTYVLTPRPVIGKSKSSNEKGFKCLSAAAGGRAPLSPSDEDADSKESPTNNQ